MEKYVNDMKVLIKFLVYGFILVMLLNFLVVEVLRLIRLTLIPTSWCIAFIIIAAFKEQIIRTIIKLAGGTRNEAK